MKLNPCKQCNSTDIRVDEEYIFCGTPYCHSNVEHDGTPQNAIAAWNTANPVIGQVDELKAVQQALAYVLLRKYHGMKTIQRANVHSIVDLDALDLLITQGVLIETDGRITIK